MLDWRYLRLYTEGYNILYAKKMKFKRSYIFPLIYTVFITGFFRIIYLGRLLQHYIVSANSELQKMRKLEPSKRDKNQLLFQQNSLKMAENTLHLTKMLAHKSPSFLFVITPSWKTENRYIFNKLWWFLASSFSLKSRTSSRKREHESEAKMEQKRKRPLPDFYVPPGGKYSGEYFELIMNWIFLMSHLVVILCEFHVYSTFLLCSLFFLLSELPVKLMWHVSLTNLISNSKVKSLGEIINDA